MISIPMRRYGAMILMLLTLVFSGSVFGDNAHNNKSHKVQ